MTLTTTKPSPSPSEIAARGPRPQAQPVRKRNEPRFHHRRGEIWIVTSDPNNPPVGTEIWSDRPAVVVSNNTINGRSGFAQVVYLSSSARKRTGPTHIPLPSPDDKGQTMALCEQIHTVDHSRLTRKLGRVPSEHMAEIDAALALSLSITRNTHGPLSLFRKWESYLKDYGIDIATECQALAGRTTDERVEALTRAIEILTRERDGWQQIYQASKEVPDAMSEVADLLQQAQRPAG